MKQLAHSKIIDDRTMDLIVYLFVVNYVSNRHG
jgi:hypothetical protein